MRFVFKHALIDTGKLVAELEKVGFHGCVSRIDRGPEGACIYIDVREDKRAPALYDQIRATCADYGLKPHEKRPERNEINCRMDRP